MIAPALVNALQKLLADGRYSQRKIAKKLDICRSSIAAIAHKQSPDHPRDAHSSEPPPPGPLIRCPGCGAKVYGPCLLCQTRRRLAVMPRRPVDPRPPERLSLDLYGEALQRYQDVHLRRLRQGELPDDETKTLEEEDPL